MVEFQVDFKLNDNDNNWNLTKMSQVWIRFVILLAHFVNVGCMDDELQQPTIAGEKIIEYYLVKQKTFTYIS